MDKIEAYNRWHNPNHGFELQPDVNTGHRATTENGILYQAEFCMLQDILGTLDDIDKVRFARTVEAVELEPGLYCRGRQEKSEDPKTRRTISHDNIDAIVFGGLICGTDKYSKDVAKYGLKHFGVFNNTARFVLPLNPGNYFEWLASSGFFFLSIFFLPIFAINYLISTNKKRQETSSKKLYLLSLYSLRNTKIFRYFFRHFCNNMVKMYGVYFIAEIYKIYYPEDHPLNFYAQGIKYDNDKFTK